MPEHQILLATQREQLFTQIKNLGLDLTKFQWHDEDVPGSWSKPGRKICKIVYRDTPYFYRFDVRPTTYSCLRCPGRHRPTEEFQHNNWDIIVGDFFSWAKGVKVELETPDLWAEAQKYQSIFSVPLGVRDTPFSGSETEQILSGLKQVKQRVVETFKIEGQQLEFVDYQFSYLELKAKDGYPRIDWLMILIGVVTTIAVTLSLSPEKAHLLWSFFREALGAVGLLR